MNDEIITENWSEFGHREIELAKELLSHIKEINSSGQVKVMFNKHSGYVFLADDDLRTWVMVNDKIEEFFSCPGCGHEGILSEMKHAGKDEEDCKNYEKQIGAN